jgi:FeS assembly SUF system protein
MSDESPHVPQRQPLTVLPDPQKEAALKALADAQAAKPIQENAAEVTAAGATTGKTLTPLEKKLLEGQVIKAVRQIYDPEIPVNIYELGLIYGIDVDDTAGVTVRMTLTAPACPVAESLPMDVEKRIEAIPEVRSATVELVWEPPWSKDRMSELARLTLDMM